MNKDSERIAYEFIAISNARFREFCMIDTDKEYQRYHFDIMGYYSHLESQYWEAIGRPKLSLPKKEYAFEEWELFLSDETKALTETGFNLTLEQRRTLFELRKKPIFKKIMGETALQHKSGLEAILGGKITCEGKTFGDETGLHRACKTEEELEQELSNYNDKLSELLSSRTITEEQYDTYSNDIFNIYNYYISISKGEQIQFRKMTDAQYEQVENRAYENGIELDEQLRKENEDLMYGHEELQELQSQQNGITR